LYAGNPLGDKTCVALCVCVIFYVFLQRIASDLHAMRNDAVRQ
jgi:hypothetical protein